MDGRFGKGRFGIRRLGILGTRALEIRAPDIVPGVSPPLVLLCLLSSALLTLSDCKLRFDPKSGLSRFGEFGLKRRFLQLADVLDGFG